MSRNPRRPRPTPYELGAMAARTLGSLKGLPYGPGERQQDYITGFQEAKLSLAHAQLKDTA